MIRRIVEINQELCNGCGACANACHENAIAMIDGKATLIKDDYCDGLGDCLPACPTNAISIIEREAAAYDEAEVKRRAEGKHQQGHGCPGSMVRNPQVRQAVNEIEMEMESQSASENHVSMKSKLQQWPVQIKLLPIQAPYYENANLLIAADCTAYAYGNFHEDFIKNHITVIGCPKLDAGEYSEKLTEILKNNAIKSVTIVRMEVPCCGGLQNAAITALQNCGKMIPWQVKVISCTGDILEN
ncbi:MAG: 4Fe-4S binding protein [Lachnospiraceae bacterium]|nr:4Fe-4S binding protein [Lachnospiraceae bacterium]